MSFDEIQDRRPPPPPPAAIPPPWAPWADVGPPPLRRSVEVVVTRSTVKSTKKNVKCGNTGMGKQRRSIDKGDDLAPF